MIVIMMKTGAKASASVLLVDLHHYSSIGYDTKTDKERFEDPALPPWLSSRTGKPSPPFSLRLSCTSSPSFFLLLLLPSTIMRHPSPPIRFFASMT